MSICQSNSWHDRVWVLSVITQSKERKKWNSVVTSLNRSSIVCLSPRWTHAVLQNIPACMGKSQSVCAITTQPQDNFWLQSVVRPPPLSKKKCGKLSKGTWSKLCVKTPKPVPGTHWSFSIPTPSSFLKFSRCPNFSPSLYWTLCRF